MNTNPSAHTVTNDISIDASENHTVPIGYYYRVKTEHWIEDDGTRKQGTAYSSSVLIN